MMNMIPDMMDERPSKSRKKASMPSSQLFESDSRGGNKQPKREGGKGARTFVKNKFKMMKSQEAIGEFIAGVQKL